ncbi:reverse transcriptase [Fusarium acutatum]|uniref:Reverse transcriptase n=1 Tax=Fusarium acutatum TaxID=78861 RepID=A0A8H4J954_9HYPO|nr:reverse transcriptase [Fusarium acutatum]
MPLAKATVKDHLATSSDHFTLSLTLPNAGSTPMQPCRIRVTTDDELKRFAEIVELGAAVAFRAIRRLHPLGFNQEVQIAKRDFHRVVRRAKRLYWRNLIDSFSDSFSDSNSVFKAARWLRSPGAFQPPLLQVDDVIYESQIDKANALRRATLERRTAEDDITGLIQ